MTCRKYLLILALACLAPNAAIALPRVAVVAASTTGTDVQSKLQQTAAFQVVDLINAATTTPTVQQLQQYDAVIVYSQQAFQNATTLGDNLATYLEAGGGVVLATWGALEQSSLGLQGRYAVTYTLMNAQPANQLTTATSTLGTIVEMGSALVSGVATFACKTTCHHLTSTLKPGANVVARWADGNPLILRGTINGHNVVELNLFPASTTIASGEWDPNTNGGALLRNALQFVVANPIKASAPSLVFSMVPVGQAFTSVATFTNTGTAPATITAAALAGANAADFALFPSAALPAKLAAGGTLDVGVVFSPTMNANRNATLQVAVQGSPGTVDVALTGTTVPGGIATSPKVLAFGGSALGVPTKKNVTFVNNTGSFQSFNSALITIGAADYQVKPTAALPVTVPDGASFDFEVTFQPTQIGGRIGQLAVTSMTGPTIQVPLTGSAGPPAISLGNAGIVFGNVHVGAASMAQMLTVVNNGYTDLHVTGMFVAGMNAADFTLTAPKLPVTVGPNSSLTYPLAFTPMGAGPRSAIITIVSDDPMTPTATFTASGQGIAYAETLTPTMPMDFGMVKAGTTAAAQTAKLTNTSNAPLLVKKVQITGALSSAFTMMNPPADNTVLAPMASLSVPVLFKPVNAVAYAGTLGFLLDDPNLPSATVSLVGQGTAGVVTASPLTIDFGGVPIGKSSAGQAVTLGNAGGAALQVSSITITGLDAVDFALVPPPTMPATIAPAGMTMLTVVFTPTAHKAETAQLVLATDDPLAPTVTIQLKGAGTQAKLSLSPTTIDFGVSLVSAPTDPVSVNIGNTGDQTLNVKTIQIQGASAGEFRVESNPAPVMLQPGSSIMVGVRFSPTKAANANAQLAITPDDPLVPGASVALKGIGVSTAVSVTPNALDFGVVEVGQKSDPQEVTVRNIAGGSITLTPIQSSSVDFAIDTTATSLTLSAGASTTFSVIFAPTMGGPIESKTDLALSTAPMRSIGMVAFTGEGAATVRPPVPSRTGGCAVSHGRDRRALGMAPIALAALLLAIRRRRRRG